MVERRDENAWWLRVMGHTYAHIAERLGLANGVAAKAAVDRANKIMMGRVDGVRTED